mgnify:CR=1 FL=1
MKELIKKILNFRFLIIIVFLCNLFIKNTFSSENFIVTTVNNNPITKKDIVNRAKLLLFSIEKKNNLNNLKNYYRQSLNSLINEKVILSAGVKINKNIIEIVAQKANILLLNEFQNSNRKLDNFLKNLSIPKSTLLDKYKSQLVWGYVLKNKYKRQLKNLDKRVENDLRKKKIKNADDLYDLAEILISQNNNNLLKQINIALRNGVGFLDLAKQISISSSAKFGGKVGWKTYDDLPNYIKRNKLQLEEGDIISFPTKDKIKIVKVLSKRLEGKLSKNELNIILAQIKFPINFQKKEDAYEKVKNNLKSLLNNQQSCKRLNIFKKENNSNHSINIIKSRIADLSSKIQNVISKVKLYEVSKPIFLGNSGYTYIICDTKNIYPKKKLFLEQKNKIMQKHYLIFSERHLKRLYNESRIVNINKLNR